MSWAEDFERISDNLGALMLLGAGIYMAVVKDFNQGYMLIILGFSYLAGKGIPNGVRKRLHLGGGVNG